MASGNDRMSDRCIRRSDNIDHDEQRSRLAVNVGLSGHAVYLLFLRHYLPKSGIILYYPCC